MNRPSKSPNSAVWRCVQRLVLRAWAIISPKWEVVEYGPLTQHLIFRGVKVREEMAEYRKEINRAGKSRVLVKEKDGQEYRISPDRLYSANVKAMASADTQTPKANGTP
jgi:hypothetical protein